jgi:hypothetical protein
MIIDTSSLVISAVVGLFVQYVLIRLAVNHGNNTAYRDQQLFIQSKLLTEMARKLGVSEEDIEKSIKN